MIELLNSTSFVPAFPRSQTPDVPPDSWQFGGSLRGAKPRVLRTHFAAGDSGHAAGLIPKAMPLEWTVDSQKDSG